MGIQAYNYEDWVTGTDQINTTESVVASGQTIAARTPMGMKVSTGELHAWDPTASDGTEKAVRLAEGPVDTTGGSKTLQLIKSGTFNPELITWPGGVTAAQKLGAFVGTPISLQAPR